MGVEWMYICGIPYIYQLIFQHRQPVRVHISATVFVLYAWVCIFMNTLRTPSSCTQHKAYEISWAERGVHARVCCVFCVHVCLGMLVITLLAQTQKYGVRIVYYSICAFAHLL